MKKRIAAVVVAALVLILMAVPAALASSGTAHCGSNGLGVTSANVGGWHTHKFGSSTKDHFGTSAVEHGWFSGSQGWSVTPGPGNGWCVQ
jgi:hypothetical protein